MAFDDDEALDTFITEARELLESLEGGLLQLEADPDDVETINAIFRSAHTLKGSSGLFGLDHLVGFAHVMETLLGHVREGTVRVTPELISILLPCADHIHRYVEGVAEGRIEPSAAEVAESEALLARLAPFDSVAEVPAETAAAPSDETPEAAVPRAWNLRLRFGPDCLRNGMDPLALLRYLGSLGTIERITVDDSALPGASDMDPETSYLAFEAELSTEAPKSEIESVFDFVREDSDIRIVPRDQDEFIGRIASMPDRDRLGDVLQESGAVTPGEIDEALRIQRERTRAGGTVPIGQVLIEQGIAPPAVVEAALRRQLRTADSRSSDTQTIRIDAGRLDRLIDLVGELVIAQAGVGVHDRLSEAQSQVTRLIDEVRHSALALRMVPIGLTLRRFERVVRDVCVDLGKEVHLTITGGDAEMDKALVERISDPLTHLVRNSLDHGIESPDDRRRMGKPARGQLRLNAYHDAGSIVIEVSDDGRGLDRDRILAKAVDRGLVPAGAMLTDHEVFDLVFEPGFSTAETVSSLSGRGVGMDVVRRNVAALRGNIEVDSVRGQGATIRIRLPLTLAIIDGFLVEVGSSSFIVPLDRVTECVEFPADDRDHDHMNLRGEVLPFIRLHQLFGLDGEDARRQSVVVVEQSGQRTGLVVDALLGEFQTVIKPLGPLFSELKCVSGSTILGNGDVALILDVGPLITEYADLERTRYATSGYPGRRMAATRC
ncbi:chemotaxis protein CheA [Actinoplanes regularis]|uniref:Chemotaxis protein CheA n=1 Tax=Actinoplanes regularis TaxID=52697 RepID=A0A238Z1B1_9ACTN|nr:chemotaxis protein CheA [Actinoplanes regularis]GIE85701.1 chemotaxis protein CheA [Actinoplanes regularis]SNR76683.1 two-component system, chemotaxis family, sensor kinase CheA [Actinoplanes regularis]